MQVVLNTNFGPRAVTIQKVGMSVVDVDLNHPMAGKDLHFDIEVAAVREASPEEVEHGHVNGDGGHEPCAAGDIKAGYHATIADTAALPPITHRPHILAMDATRGLARICMFLKNVDASNRPLPARSEHRTQEN